MADHNGILSNLRIPEKGATMSSGSGGNQNANAWCDNWGCGQGIGAVTSPPSVGELVNRPEADWWGAVERIAPGNARLAAVA